ncbi:hypothetical protein EUGRSUZ_C04276 [Eucalyptus grandis]|uniref:Uncharacterized protein n=2 Tax=Eucalyptus grandis TaxID=71139 RepID=A0ACC3LK36_EUCGR|nr:hypothetical protein EUGRSUZ_C04276 [Eucalyptus grandis]
MRKSRKHERRRIDRKVIYKWKQALGKITEMMGYDLQKTNEGHGAIIETVVSYVLEWLKKNDLDVTDGLVGMEPHVREVMKKLGVIYVNEQATGVYDKDIRVLGIYGMPGIGKTTIAKVVYNKIHRLFQRCSFLSNIRENGASSGLIMGLQAQLISDFRRKERRTLVTLDQGTKVIESSFSEMKVLILLDDVHHFDQIKHLVGKLSWFGPGSRILMTVGRIDVLDGYRNGVVDKYEVGEMGPHQALQLFCKHAFNGYTCEEDDEYDSLSIDIIETIGGIPLAIEVAASYLHKYRGERQVWQDTLDSLRRKPEDKVQEAINVSYGSLNEETRKIFLDIACFFIGTDERIPSYMWRACKFDPRGIIILRDMAFPASMGLQRLVLERCSIISQIGPLIGNLKNLVSLNLKFCTFIRDLPQELCHMKHLEELLIDGTAISKIDFKSASMKKLKILSACQCKSLAHISDSIGHLESLLHLRLDGAAIDRLPESIGSLKKLRSLLLANCQNLTWLPCSIGNLESLEAMDISSTKIATLPRSVKQLKNLKVLKMENTHLEKFPEDIKNLEMLEEIDLSQCMNLKGRIICDIRGLSSLKILRLSSTKITGLPWTLSLLYNLQQLDLIECDQLWDLQRLPSSLIILRWGSKTMRAMPDLSFLRNLKELYLGDPTDPMQNSSPEPPQIGWLTRLANLEILELCLSKITVLPENFRELQLRKLVLHFPNLLDLQQLPSSLAVLCLQHCTIQDSHFSRVRGLSELEFKHCHLAEAVSFEDLRRLELLKISDCNVRTLNGLEYLPRFRKITVMDCPSLTGLPDRTNRTFEIDGYNFPGEQIVGSYVARTYGQNIWEIASRIFRLQ